jgi:microcystin-dependent protein
VSEPFLGEIKIVSFNFAPKGWALCNGQLLPINQNQALFSLFGTTYGGDGRVNFALPNLRGRVPIHVGGGFVQGELLGEEVHTLTISEMPTHPHVANGSTTPAETNTATNAAYLGLVNNAYTGPANLVAMAPGEISNTGGSQAHENRQPYLVLNFVVALQGIFPSQN